MPKVLILTAGYGEGHNAAARGLQMAFAERGADVEILDLFALTGGEGYAWSRRAYLDLINRAPHLWAAIYRFIDRAPMVSLTLPFMGAMFRTLRRLLDEKQPVAVLSVYPVYGYLIEQLYPQTRPFAFHTVVTDSITINSVWHRCASDSFIVPNEDSARVMVAAGVPPAKVRTLGFPVPPRFSRDRPARPAPTPPRVLYMINAGRDQAPAIVRRLLAIEPLHLTVTVGRDEALRATLEQVASAAGRPLEIHGWTPHMPELLMTHHVLIGKAGGATVQESIAACTPMLLTQIIPGQEEGNAQLLLDNHCGALCETPDALAAAIERAFAADAAVWREWERNITRLSRPDAALRIADAVLGGIPSFAMNPGPPISTRVTSPIQAMLFDIGNVIVKFDFAIALRKIAAQCERHDCAEVLAAIDGIRAGYEDGKIDRASFLRGAFDALRYRGTEAEFVAAWEEIFDPNAPMLALIEQLHGQLPLYLLSNTSDIHREYLFRRYPIFGRFTAGVYSYEAHASKPGREIYEIAIRQLALEPSATFFIDDLLPNIETARTLGFRAHHYHHERHDLLTDELSALNVPAPIP